MSDFKKLEEMMLLQKVAQETTYDTIFDDMLEGERIEFIKWNVLALTDELHEALAEVGWKPWASSRHIKREAYVGELVDAWHFLMNLFLVVGVDADELYDRYVEKRQRNDARMVQGYDGVTGKCPVCRRALDDSKASAAYHPYCSMDCEASA